MPHQDMRLAVLIDADNVPRKSIKNIMEELAVYGTPTIKRIYGDWTSTQMNSWKSALLENAIIPIQQYGYTKGKNSTDSAMIIDAMDILYTEKVDAFCLVSSDSDFTRLALRLRESGMRVFGIGEKKTPQPFIVACDRFIYIEILSARKEPAPTPAPVAAKKKVPASPAVPATPAPQGEVKNGNGTPSLLSSPAGAVPLVGESGSSFVPAPVVATVPSSAPASDPVSPAAPSNSIPQEMLNFISNAIDDVGDDDGWAYLGEVGGLLQKKQPDFDSRNYGFKKLTLMIASCDCFEMDIRENLLKGNGKLIFVRNKRPL